MKDKKNIIFLIIAIVLFLGALLFAIWAFSPISEDTNEVESINDENTSVENEIKNQNDIIQNLLSNTIVEDEVSQTKDLDATYTDFVVFDENNNEIKLSDYKDSAVMVLFWNSDNEDSVEMLSRVNSEYDKYKNKIQFLAINTQDENLDNLNSKYNLEITMPVYYDSNNEASNKFNIDELPAMLYINKENEVFNAKTGLTTKDALEANLDILAENY